jgi:hypothetical protein
MSQSFRPPEPDVVEAIRKLSERRLSVEEFDAYVNAPMSDEERREIRELIDWFQQRYPRPIDRLISSRRAHARAIRRGPGASL